MQVPIPDTKTLPFVVIVALGSAVLGLVTHIVKKDAECKDERKELQAKYDLCKDENAAIYRRQAAYNLRQDSINTAHLLALENKKRK